MEAAIQKIGFDSDGTTQGVLEVANFFVVAGPGAHLKLDIVFHQSVHGRATSGVESMSVVTVEGRYRNEKAGRGDLRAERAE